MNQNLQIVSDFIENADSLTTEEKATLTKALKAAENELMISEFKLERTDKVKHTTAILLEETIEELDQKRKAVEAQNRELEIEAALERVRARTMAMQKSDELAEVGSILFKQLANLGINPETSWITFIDPEEECLEIRVTHGDKLIEPVAVSAKDHENFKKEIEAWKSGKESIQITMPKEEFMGLVKVLFNLDVQDNPELSLFHILNVRHKFGFIGIGAWDKISDKQIKIYQRFAKVFEQTYTRFLDLQKAEEQAREAQIEASLERVRSRSLAMHKSDELGEVAAVLFEQISLLTDTPDRFNISIANESDRSFNIWLTDQKGHQITTKFNARTSNSPVIAEVYHSWEEQEKYNILDLYGEKLENWIKYMGDEVGIPFSKNSVKDHRFITNFFFSYGFIGITTNEPPAPDTLKLLERFTKVFQQTYTRFLDLQKAEAQAREAQINLAVERVRAKALAMFESEEILQVVNTLKNEIMGLDIPNVSAATIHLREPDGKYRIWDLTSVEDDGNGIDISLDVCYRMEDTHPDFFMREVWSRTEDYFVVIQGLSRTIHTINWLWKNGHADYANEFAAFLEESGLEKAYHPTVPLQNGRMSVDTLDEPTPEIETILKKMASAFDLAYKRFEDLKKAEAQSRESQIELALERIRARTMAMQSSEELADVAFILFEQLRGLGGNLWGTGFGLCEKNNDKDSFWFANENGVFPPVSIPNTTDPAHQQMFEGWKAGKDFLSIESSGKDLKSHYNYMLSLPEVKPFFQKILDEGLSFPEWQQWNATYFKHGYLLIITLEPYPDPDILVRFAKVFEQTYTRFLDLKKAEAQAKEANIQLALERVRAKSMAMKTQSDLLGIIELFGQQLNAVDIRFGMVTFIEGAITKDRDWDLWSHTPEAETPTQKIFIPYIDHPYFTKTAKNVEKYQKTGRPIQVKSFTKKEKNTFLPHFLKHAPALPDEVIDFLYASPDEMIVDAFLEEITVSLVKWNADPFTKEELEIFERFAKEFRQTYIRFLDIKKAEEQAREAQIEVALERVRSRSMAMHQSDELVTVVREIGKGIHELGIQIHYSQIFTDYSHDPKTGINIWVDAEEQNYLEKFHIPYVDHLITHRFYDPLNEGLKFFGYQYSKSEKDSYFKLLFEHSDLKIIPRERKELILDASGWTRFTVVLSEASLNFGRYSLESFNDEEKEIFKRFGKVFGQAYTRFLDLKNAEAQAREARIETALEKVRSRSLAMHKSDELNEVVKVLFEKMTELEVPSTAVAIQTFTEGSKDMQCFVCGDVGTGIVISEYLLPYFDHPIIEDFHKAREKDLDFYVGNYSKKEKDSFYDVVLKRPELRDLPAEVKTMIKESDFYEITMVPAEKSLLAVNDFHGDPLSENQVNILKRFAKVFDQAYIRFLDLQNAEEQAREAQIEAALERVRSRSMGMQKSTDLRSVVDTMYGELKRLGLVFHAVVIQLLLDDSKDMHMWINIGDVSPYDDIIHWPYVDIPMFNAFYEARTGNKTFDYRTSSEAETRDFFEEYFKLEGVPKERKDALKNVHLIDNTGTYQKHTGVFLMRYTEGEYSEKDKEIVRRFSKVFEQTYTRFLDLQKAEAQAREAQIEAALERVRSRTMAMQKSDELADTSIVIFEELINLGIEPNRLFIGIIKDKTGTIEAWATNEDGTKIGNHFTLNTDRNESVKKMYEGWKLKKSSITIDMQGKELENYFHYLSDEMHIPFKGGLSQKRRVQTIAYFGQGLIGMASPNVQPEATTQLLERFAAVFNLTYTRFNDLKIAEAHAVQARKDLIKLKKAKKRAEDAFTKLEAAKDQLVQQEKLASLGQLTAGIAHEIKNPLNFVTNFSEVSVELIEETKAELSAVSDQLSAEDREKVEEALGILKDIEMNLQKIHEHGSRADSIVKSMLQHSRGGNGKLEPEDLNALVKEYTNLSFHGMRATKDPINVGLNFELAEDIGKVPLIAEDFSRVIVNLCNNAFDAMRSLSAERSAQSERYQPKLIIRSRHKDENIIVEIEDNGPGIPEGMKDKILQPFFTTKKGTQGTGLGLSITNDIIKAHGGEIDIESVEGEKTRFIIKIPRG